MKHICIRNTTLCIFLLSSFSSLLQGHKTLIELALAITTANHEIAANSARYALLKEFKENPTTHAKTLATIVTAYHYDNPTLLYCKHSHTLYGAIERFSKTPGFSHKIYELISNADNESFIQGHMYELEKAIELDQHGETITHFGYEFSSKRGRTTRSIDLATESQFIECKNINWALYKEEDAIKIAIQLKKYQKFSQRSGHGKSFVLHSKQPITPCWKKWLNENKIQYIEEPIAN